MNKEAVQKHYKEQINRVIDHIYAHLDQPLDLKILSAQVDLSPYHFHRIFSAEMGEPLAKFVTRRRLERAASLLLSAPDVPVMNIAYDCGFNSIHVFCRNFKRHFGMTAEAYRNKNQQPDSKNSPFKSITDTTDRLYSRYFCSRKTIITGGKTMNCTFEIKNLPPQPIIYCRHQGALDQMQEAFAKLMQWAYPRGLVTMPGMKLLSVYHDNPDVTEKGKLTADAGMTVNETVKTEGEIGQYELSGGLYAVGRFEIGMEEFPNAWHAMFDLVAEHGCQCTNGHHYEIYQNNRDEHPEKKWVVDICIPVKYN